MWQITGVILLLRKRLAQYVVKRASLRTDYADLNALSEAFIRFNHTGLMLRSCSHTVQYSEAYNFEANWSYLPGSSKKRDQRQDSFVMFFLHELERVITLHPSFFGPKVKEYLTNRLLEDVEGMCEGQYYIICVMDAFDISEGKVMPGSAVAQFTVHYRAVVWRPFKGETVGGPVLRMTQMLTPFRVTLG